MDISNTTFTSNQFSYGGGIYLELAKGVVTFNGVTFENNTAQIEGGAIAVYGSQQNLQLVSSWYMNIY
jgi:predicted outer membrane repeat protein